MDTRSLRSLTAATLVLGPALFLAGNLLHPKEYSNGHEAQQLAEIAGAYTRWQVAHALAFLAAVVLAGAVAGLASLVGRGAPGAAAPAGSPRVALAGGALGIAGLIGIGAAVAIDGYTWGLLGEVSSFPAADDHTLGVALTGVQQSNWALLYYLTPVAFVLGLIVLAVAAVREELVPAWAGGLLAIGVLMAGAQLAIVSNAYFIAAAAVLLAGGVAMAIGLTRPAPDA